VKVRPPVAGVRDNTVEDLILSFKASRAYLRRSGEWEKDPWSCPSVPINHSTPNDEVEEKIKTEIVHAKALIRSLTKKKVDPLCVYGINQARMMIAECVKIWRARDLKRSLKTCATVCDCRQDFLQAALQFSKLAEVTPGNGWWYLQISTESLYTGLKEWDDRVKKYERYASVSGTIKK